MSWQERPRETEKRFYWAEGDIRAQIDGCPGSWSYSVFKGDERHAFGVEKVLAMAKYKAREIIKAIGGDK